MLAIVQFAATAEALPASTPCAQGGLGSLVTLEAAEKMDGLIVKHWDVFQPEATETANGNPMFVPDPARNPA